jgi:hypothetical protein
VLADNGSAFTCRTRSTGITGFTRVVKLPPKRGGIDYKESHAREAEEVRC